MKKFLTLFMVSMLTLVLTTSCNVKPNFEFKTEITCYVFDQKSNVTFTMPTSTVSNLQMEPITKMLRTVSATLSSDSTEVIEMTTVTDYQVLDTTIMLASQNPTEAQIQEADDFITDFIKTNVITQLSEDTQYSIKLKGFVRETVTGIVIAIDKEITNIIK